MAVTDGVVKSKYSNGTIKAELVMKNGRAKEYFKSGKLSMEIDYVDNIKQGTLRRHYETGTLYKEANYVDGQLSGLEKHYRADGSLEAEVPYG